MVSFQSVFFFFFFSGPTNSEHRWPLDKIDGPGKRNKTHLNQWNPSMFSPGSPKKDTNDSERLLLGNPLH